MHYTMVWGQWMLWCEMDVFEAMRQELITFICQGPVLAIPLMTHPAYEDVRTRLARPRLEPRVVGGERGYWTLMWNG